MSIRKSSTEKPPKKVKEPKAKKTKEPKVKKTKSKKGDESVSFSEVAFDAPVAAPKQKKRSPKAPKDVYTLVLLLSFLFFIAATVFLYLDLASYK